MLIPLCIRQLLSIVTIESIAATFDEVLFAAKNDHSDEDVRLFH